MTDKRKYRVIMFGLGQQSTVLVEMAIEGKLQVDEIITCDTGEEMPQSYDTLEFYKKRLEAANIKFTILKRDYPLYEHFYSQNKVPLGWVNPYCSSHFKRDLANSHYRKTLSNGRLYAKDIEIIEYLGITTDEIGRMKPAKESWKTKEYPLIEMGMSRQDCINYLKDRYIPIPVKSGCWLCPNKSWNYFKEMKYNQPKLFEKLIQLEKNAEKYNATLKGKPMSSIHQSEDLRDWFCDGGFCHT